MVFVTLEVEHGIHHVLEDPRTGYRPVLRHVPHDHRRDAKGLRDLRETRGAGPDLSDTPRHARDFGIESGLDRIEQQQIRPLPLDELGLAPTLRRYVNDFGRETGATITVNGSDRDDSIASHTRAALFRLIQQETQTPWQEMYKVFNMGHRLELYVPQEIAPDLIHIAQSFHIEARMVGRCESYHRKKLTLVSPYGTFEYS